MNKPWPFSLWFHLKKFDLSLCFFDFLTLLFGYFLFQRSKYFHYVPKLRKLHNQVSQNGVFASLTKKNKFFFSHNKSNLLIYYELKPKFHFPTFHILMNGYANLWFYHYLKLGSNF